MARLLSPGPHTSVLVALFLLLSAASASAQTRLYILFSGDTGAQCQPQDCESGRVLEVDVDGRRFQAATPIAHARYNASGLVITPDGQFLLWNGSEAAGSGLAFLSLFDTPSRQQSLLGATSSRGFTVPLFAHPSAMRVFYQPDQAMAITVAEPDGSHTLSVVCADGVLSGESGDGSRLFVRCRTTPVIPSRTIAIDSASGASVGEVPLGPFRQASNDIGTELYTWTRVNTQPVFRRYDVALGRLLAAQPGTAEDRSDGSMQIDPRTGNLFADALDGLHVRDGTTLTTITRVASPSPGASARFVFDPDQPVMFVVWTAALSTGGYRSRIAMIDTATFGTMAEADLPLDVAVVGMVMGPRPPRAVNLSSTVADHSVMLQWTNQESRSIATSLVVEAGSHPGATNLARICAAAGTTSLWVPNVPPGTYFVRVRAVNGTGNGEPSNEIIVVVR